MTIASAESEFIYLFIDLFFNEMAFWFLCILKRTLIYFSFTLSISFCKYQIAQQYFFSQFSDCLLHKPSCWGDFIYSQSCNWKCLLGEILRLEAYIASRIANKPTVVSVSDENN